EHQLLGPVPGTAGAWNFHAASLLCKSASLVGKSSPFRAARKPSGKLRPAARRLCADVGRGLVAKRHQEPISDTREDSSMRKELLAAFLSSAAALTASGAWASDELIKMSQNAKDWVMPAGDYANTRYSKLNQINASNVGKLQAAWTFSTGVLRGHEGG